MSVKKSNLAKIPELLQKGLEELNVQSGSEIDSIRVEEESKVSPSYPGLATEYLRHEMKTNLSAAAFKPEGYIEHQADKSTYFVWRELK